VYTEHNTKGPLGLYLLQDWRTAVVIDSLTTAVIGGGSIIDQGSVANISASVKPRGRLYEFTKLYKDVL